MTKCQPPPIANDNPPVWPVVIARVKARRGRLEGPDWATAPTHDALAADMEARDALGRERYGVALQAGNGRDALCDLYEGVLDACAYSEQHAIESGTLRARMLADRLVVLALEVRGMIGSREAS